MRVLDIIAGTVVDGVGLRTSIYFAGCLHHCEGCHNPESWDMDGGREVSVDYILGEVKKNGFNVTLSGGDPLFQDLNEICELCKRIHKLGFDIWLYTGFTMEILNKEDKFKKVLENVDVVVDGPFIKSEKSDEILFRGSKNQRIFRKKGNKWDIVEEEELRKGW